MKEIKGKTLTILHKKVMAEKAKGKNVVGGVMRDKDNNYVVIMF